MNAKGPLAFSPPLDFHKTLAERRESVSKAKSWLETFSTSPITMYVDAMNDGLEAKYEARPWRVFVIEAASGKLLADTGLAPFNMDAKLAAIKEALK